MHADLESIVCKFGGDPTISVGEEAICAKIYTQTDEQTDDGRCAVALAHSWNELKNEKSSPDIPPPRHLRRLDLAIQQINALFCMFNNNNNNNNKTTICKAP